MAQAVEDPGAWGAVAVETPAAWGATPAGPPAKSTATEAFGRGLANGVTFNFYDELSGLARAGGLEPDDPNVANALKALFVGAHRKFSGDPEAEKLYNEEVARVRGQAKQMETEHPTASLAGNVGGALLVPLGGVLQAATLPARIGRSAAVGAGFGALSGAGEGEQGLADRGGRALTGAAVGGVVGGVAAPVVEGAVRATSALAQPIVSTIRGIRDPSAEATRRIGTAVQRDIRAGDAGLTDAEFAAAQAQGLPVSTVDQGGTTTRALARSAANTSPEARAALERTTNDRFESQSARTSDWLGQTFNFPNAQRTQEAIDKVEKTVNRAAYGKALKEGDKEIWSPELERLTSSPDVVAAMKEAATKGKSRAVTEGFGGFNPGVTVDNGGIVTFQKGPTGQPTYPNLQFWDYTKRALDDSANAARRAGRNEEAATLGNLSRSLRGELDNIVPSYGNARAGAAAFFGAENALEAGQNFVGAAQRYGIPETRATLGRMTPQERQLFQDGYVSRFIEKVDRTGDRRNILNQIANSNAAREELNLALGPVRARELEARMRVEQIMDRMRGALGNSTTVRQLVEAGLAGGATGIYTGDLTSAGSAAGLVFALRSGGKVLGQRIDQNVSRRVGELLASPDPALVQRGIAMISNNPVLMRVLRAADDSTARIGGQQVAPAVPALQGPVASRAEAEQP